MNMLADIEQSCLPDQRCCLGTESCTTRGSVMYANAPFSSRMHWHTSLTLALCTVKARQTCTHHCSCSAPVDDASHSLLPACYTGVLNPSPPRRSNFRLWDQSEVSDDISSQLPSSPVADTFAQLMTGLYAKLQSAAGKTQTQGLRAALNRLGRGSSFLTALIFAGIGPQQADTSCMSSCKCSANTHGRLLCCHWASCGAETHVHDHRCYAACCCLLQVTRLASPLGQPGVQPWRQHLKWAANNCCWVSNHP